MTDDRSGWEKARKGYCRVCDGEYLILKDGTIRAHGWGLISRDRWCAGSHEPPLGQIAMDPG